MEKLLLIGGGGHCAVVIDAIQRQGTFKIAGIIDANIPIGEKVLGVEILGSDRDLGTWHKKGIKNCFISAGSVANTALRIRLQALAKKIGYRFPNVIHPDCLVSKYASFGCGNYLAPYAIINARAEIGNNCIINTGAIIEHDCLIEDFVHVAPGATLSGGVTVRKGAHIGAGSVIIQCLTIGERTVIGAGSVVIKDIGAAVTACGNPCKKIKKNEE